MYLVFFMACGLFISRLLLPGLRPPLRGYIGLSLGAFMLMWLPAIAACFMRFTLAAHAVAAAIMAALVIISWLLRDRRRAAPADGGETRALKALAFIMLPLVLLSCYLQYTHSIRLAPDGTYHVGQSTYGDLSLHLAVCTSAVNAEFPLQNSLMLGATMAYPYLSDTFATSMYMLGMPLNTAMAFTGSIMMCLVYAGYALLCARLCKTRSGACLAFALLFLNGGLGFIYTLGGRVEGGAVTTVLDNLETVLHGYYQTPTNQPDPNNLRWSNIICDMLIPQRGILGGWTLLLPCLNLLLPPLISGERLGARRTALMSILAGGMPMVHTHSFLALALASLGICAYCLVRAPRGERLAALRPFLLYAGMTAALSLPQLLNFTFVQAGGSDHFLSFRFNWINNRGGNGMIDPYFWFYIKNVGLPYLLIIFALFEKNREGRMILTGAFTIYAVAELIRFQPNDYDNNKLFYCWFMLCLPMAADYAVSLYERLRGLRARRLIAGLFLFTCFASAGLTIAREVISDYEVYSREDILTAEYIKQSTPDGAVFLTGNQHLNPVSSLAGRTILCSSELYLYYHGFDTSQRRREICAFYEDPRGNLGLLEKYGVEYIYVSAYERDHAEYIPDEEALLEMFPVVYESPSKQQRIFMVTPESVEEARHAG